MGGLLHFYGLPESERRPYCVGAALYGGSLGALDELNTFTAMVNNVANERAFSAFGLGRHQMPFVAVPVLAGGNVRVGLADNLMLDKGVLTTNEALVSRVRVIIENLGAAVIGPDDARAKLGLTNRMPE